VLDGDAIAIPSTIEPQAVIYPLGSGWFLEGDDIEVALAPGDSFVVGGRSWRFECPRTLASTEAADTRNHLDEVTLAFEISLNEEHAWLSVRDAKAERDLGERTCFYLGAVLARQRTGDRLANSLDPGWLRVDDLLKMLPEYGSTSALNVEIYRLRRALTEAGVQDAALVVERRRGEVRFGTDHVEIRTRE
jgi:hypothetical protein